MIVYCDTSSLVKAYVDEPGCDVVRQLLSTAGLVSSSKVAFIEMHSTFARLRREGRLTSARHSALTSQFEKDWTRMLAVEVDDEIVRLSGDLAERHGLTALDAIHLASFTKLLERSTEDDVHFSSFDDRLTRAAKRLK